MVDIGQAMEPEFGSSRNAASIKIIGVGGGGGNAANRMYNEGIQDVDFIICNSDQQDLAKSPIPNKVRLGEGLGCGSNAEKGEQYAKEKTAEIEEMLTNTQMVFITAGMGGGTGTGAAPVIAEICKNKGILTVAIVTIPYRFEGAQRYQNALRGIEALSQSVDSILVVNNQTLREHYGDLKLTEAFKKADDILAVATRAIADIMQKTGFVNVDFEDVRNVMKNSGVAVMAAGNGSGEQRAFDAIERTLDSPLLNKADIRGAKKILLNITSSVENELTGDELEIIMEYIRQKAETDVNITWGYMMDTPESGEEVQITMIATGFEISDIPDFKQKEEPKTIVFKSGTKSEAKAGQCPPTVQSAPVQEPAVKPGMQTNLFAQDNEDISVSHSSFDYGKVKGMDDISNLETQPAYLRQQQKTTTNATQIQTSPQQTRSQATIEAVASRINGTNPSKFSIDKDSKGIALGDNKYLNHNVD